MAKQDKSKVSKSDQQKQGRSRNRRGESEDGGKRGQQGRDRQRGGDDNS